MHSRTLGPLALLLLTVLPRAGAQDVRILDLPARDLAYDPARRTIYASVPGSGGSRANTITPIDPVAGTLGASVYVGSEPGRMVFSSAGRCLWVALDGANAVRRFDPATRTAGIQFPLGTGLSAADLAVVAGEPNVVAVARANRAYSPSDNGVALYENGAPRPKTAAAGNSLVFSPLTGRLYGYEGQISSYGIRTLQPTSAGVEEAGYVEGLLIGNARLAGESEGLLYTDNGKALDPETRSVVGSFPNIGWSTPMTVDGSVGRAFFVLGEYDGRNTRIVAYSLKTFAPVAEMPVPDLRGGAGSLIRWGEDGLAFRTSEGQVVLVRNAALVGAKVPAVDLALTQTGLPATIRPAGPLTVTLTVRNRGNTPATGVFLADGLSKGVDVLAVTSSQGSATVVAGGIVRAELGALAPGKSAVVTVRLRTGTAERITHTAFVRAGEPDANPGNNRTAGDTTILAPPGGLAAAPPAAPAVPGMELTGTWERLAQTSVGSGETIQCTLEGAFTARNAGTKAVPASTLRFFLADGPQTDQSDVLLQEVALPALAPGKTVRVELRAKLPEGFSAITMHVIAVLDPTKAIEETDEKNNQIARQIP